MDRDQVLDVLREYKLEHEKEYGIVSLGIFGSVARDTADENSDIDICIQTETPNAFALVHIKEDIETRLKRRVDIVRLRERMNPFLKKRIQKESVYV